MALLGQLPGAIEKPVEIGRGHIDMLQPVWRNVDEFGNVDGAIGRRGVLNQDGGAVVALLVDVRQYLGCLLDGKDALLANLRLLG